MKRFAVLIVLSAASVAVAGKPAVKEVDPEDFAVFIAHTDATGAVDSGSGTVVASEQKKALILTCAHVAPNWAGDKLTVKRRGKDWSADWVAGSKVTQEVDHVKQEIHLSIDGVDLSVIQIDADLPAASLAAKVPSKGDRLRSFGFAGGYWKEGPFPKVGKVEDPDAITCWLDARPGDSGSALFDSDGRIVGVISERPLNVMAVGSISVPLPEVRKFLSKNTPKHFKSLNSQLQKEKP